MTARLLRIPEVLDRLQISRSTLHVMVKDGRLSVVRLGRAVRIPAESVEKLMEPAA